LASFNIDFPPVFPPDYGIPYGTQSVILTVNTLNSFDVYIGEQLLTVTKTIIGATTKVTFDYLFIPNSSYTLSVKEGDIVTFYDLTTEGYWGNYDPDIYYYSYFTQMMANDFPEYTYLRRFWFSLGQRLLNPIAKRYEEINRDLLVQINNKYPRLANLKSLEEMYTLDMENIVDISYTPDNEVLFTPPDFSSIRAGRNILIQSLESNSLRELDELAAPTDITLEAIGSYTDELFLELDETELPIATEESLPFSGFVWVECLASEYVDKDLIPIKVIVEAEDEFGIEIKEEFNYLRNIQVKSINAWKKVTSIKVECDPDATFLVRFWLAPSSLGVFDLNRTVAFNSDRMPYPTLWRIANGDIQNFVPPSLDPKTLIALPVDDHEFSKYRCSTPDGRPAPAVSVLPSRINDDLYTLDKFGRFIVYKKDQEIPAGITDLEQDQDADIILDGIMPRQNIVADEVLRIVTYQKRVSNTINKYRYKVSKPSGTIYMKEGVEVLAANAWTASASPGSLLATPNGFSFTLNEAGLYIITLEVQYINGDIVKSSFAADTSYKKPIAVFDLSYNYTFVNPSLIYLSTGDIGIMNSGIVYKVEFHKDYYLLDYDTKTGYFTEDYQSLRLSDD